MTATLVSLLNILLGIIAVAIFTKINKKYSFGLIGNTLVATYGVVFFIKSFGRLGCSPKYVVQDGNLNAYLMILGFLVAVFGAIGALVLSKKVLKKY